MKKLALSLPVVLLTTGLANANILPDNAQPYVGIDLQTRQQSFSGVSKDLFQKNSLHPQTNIFAGLKFDDCYGVEFGYEQSAKVKKDKTFNLGDTFYSDYLGEELGGGDFIKKVVTKNEYKTRAIHLSVLGYYPIIENTTHLYGGVGLSYRQVKLRHQILSSTDTNNEVKNLPNNTQQLSKSKLIPRVTVGISHMFQPSFGVRANATWENTSRFKNLSSKSFNPDTGQLKVNMKDNFSYGVGLFYKF